MSYAPQRLALNAADMVATVSQTSKYQIEQVKLTHHPIVVVPNAPRDLSSFIEKTPVTKDIKNLVYMGSFMPYKNVETLIAGMEFLPEFTLHLLSRISPKRQKELTKKLPNKSQVVFHNGTSDEEYAQLLIDNALLVTASLDEGYGLPIAEAAALGTPAVISDLEVFHEVAGKGALYFNPKSPQDFADKVIKASSKEEYVELVKEAKNHIKNFSWDKSAHILLDAIKHLVHNE